MSFKNDSVGLGQTYPFCDKSNKKGPIKKKKRFHLQKILAYIRPDESGYAFQLKKQLRLK